MSKYRRRSRREFGGETVEYIIVILAVVVIGGGLMGFGNQVSGQIGITGNSISSWFGKANGAGDNASGGNGSGVGNNAGGENKGDENNGSQLQAPTVSVTGMDVVGERVTAKVSNLPEGATRVSYQWQYSPTKTGTFSDIEYGGNKNSYEISEEDEYYYLRCKVTTSSSKGKVPDAYSETIGEVYVFDWVKNIPPGAIARVLMETRSHAALPPITHQLRFQVWVKGITPPSSSTTSFPISRRAISPTDGLNASVLETGPRVLSRNSAPAHLCLSQVYRDRTSIAR